jgi:hypothetical protein
VVRELRAEFARLDAATRARVPGLLEVPATTFAEPA